ncbi:MAG: hypothetical protein HOE90_19765 [Bacteriovoracaceae bacterium]|jgi:hypothetical protein|nr:hypothetical protein [Bacteriovoracaceae bacterium]
MSFKDNQKQYLKELREGETDEFWDKVALKGARAFVWKTGQESPHSLDVSVQDNSQNESINIDVPSLLQNIFREDYKQKLIYFKLVTASDDQFFTQGQISCSSCEAGDKFSFHPSGQFYKAVKRENCRYQIGGDEKVIVNLAGFDYECFDISAGGLSFLLQMNESELFDKGTEYKNAPIKYNQKRFNIDDLKIVAILFVDMTKNKSKDHVKIDTHAKVCVQFDKINNQVQDDLWLAVNKSLQSQMSVDMKKRQEEMEKKAS